MTPAAPASYLYLMPGEALARVTAHEPPRGGVPDVPEAVVQDLWRGQLLRHGHLRTTAGADLVVVDPGRLNTADGPDFTAAHLRIGGREWRGDVEVHTASSEWTRHGHHVDPRYNAVVLHVTLSADLATGTLRRGDGTLLPELVLSAHLAQGLHAHLLRFFDAPDALPCAWSLDRGDAAARAEWVRTMAQRRMLRLAREAGALGDRAPALLAARTLGAPHNGPPLAALAARLDLGELRRMLPLARERAVLSAAGLLDRSLPLRSARELAPDRLLGLPWRYGGVRPAGTPDLRLAQWAGLLAPGRLLAANALSSAAGRLAGGDYDALLALTSAAPTDYWQHHYRVGRVSRPHSAEIGRSVRERLIVNALLPVLIARGAEVDDALRCLDALAAETDRRTRRFPPAFVRQSSALVTQGLHELDRRYCGPGRCLSCAVGRAALDGASEARGHA